MDRDFEIKIGDKGLPQQFYRGKSFTLSSGERYFNNGRNKMSGQWHGGKGSTKRKGADDDAYRNNYDSIFGNINRRDEEHSNRDGSSGDAEKQDTDGDLPQTGR